MTKSELIALLAEKHGDGGYRLYHRDYENIVNCFFETISATLARGDRARLRGFGVARQRASRPPGAQ